MDFDALVSFNHVAAHGGFGHASRATGHPKTTLSRHVRDLEESLGVRLVERGSRSFRLTDEGAALRARTEGLLAEVESAAQDIAAGLARPRGRLRVSAPVLFAHVAMGRIAAEFAVRYPDVRLEVSADDRIVDLVGEGYDAVIRVDPRPAHGLVGRCFLRDQHVIVAPASLAPPDMRRDAAASHSTPAVALTGALTGARDAQTWLVSRGGHSATIRPEPVVRLSSLLMVRDAVRAGAGAALLPLSIVADDLAAGRLVSWGAASDRSVELWVLHTSRRLVSPKVEAFVSFLCAAYSSGAPA